VDRNYEKPSNSQHNVNLGGNPHDLTNATGIVAADNVDYNVKEENCHQEEFD
jgi:hypothetical protein